MESPAQVYDIITQVLNIFTSPTELILNDMQKISTLLGGTSSNDYSELAHNKFLDMFNKSSKKEQDRIVLHATELFSKVEFKIKI